MRTYADPPATFVRGEGTVLFDADGTEYLDFITGLAVVSLGHAHPAVADAVAEQARTLSHVSNLYGNTLAPEVARTIDRLINGGTGQAGGQVFFANSGAEANECALEAGPPLGGRRPPCGDQRRQLVPRPHAGHADRHGPAREAGAVPTPARGFRARPLRRRRRARQGARPRHRGRRAARAAPGRGRRRGPELGLPRRGAVAVHRAQRPPHARRGADRARAAPATGSPSRPRGSSPTW